MIDITRAAHEAETVRKARPDELARLAAVLAHAFYDDPPIRWVITNDGRRRRLLERSFGLYLHKLWFKQDACYTTDSVVGAIVWERPGQWKVGVLDQLRLLPSMARINGRLLPRILRAIAALESNHPVEPHYYLPLVGVDPEWQGRGLGTALMRPIVERCDTEKVPAYLEATTPRNRALYARHGFEATEQFSLGPGSPRCGGCGGLRSAEQPPPPSTQSRRVRAQRSVSMTESSGSRMTAASASSRRFR